MTVEDQLRSTLRGAAVELGDARPGPGSTARAMRARRRRQLARRTGLAGAALAVALVVPAVLGTGWLPGHGPGGAAAPLAGSPDDGVLDGPPRGPLAGDQDFLAGLLALRWADPGDTGPDPAPADRRVVWAGDVPGGRWALVVADLDGELLGSWYTGPVGADPIGMTRDEPPHAMDADAPAAHTAGPDGVLVVVAAVGDRVELSQRAQLRADGTVTRDYTPLATPDGVAVTTLDASTEFGDAASYRVLRDGRVVQRASPTSVWFVSFDRPPVDAGRVADWQPNAAALRAAVQDALHPLGLTLDQVQASGLWAGAVPSPVAQRASAVLVAVRTPSGGMVLVGEWALDPQLVGPPNQTYSYSSASPCALVTVPADVDPATATVAMRCDVQDVDGGPRLSALVVSGPAAAVSAVPLDDSGRPVGGALPLTDGGASTTFPEGSVTVRFLAADGAVLGEAKIPVVPTYDAADALYGDFGD